MPNLAIFRISLYMIGSGSAKGLNLPFIRFCLHLALSLYKTNNIATHD